MLCSMEGFGISVCIAHADRSRRRLLVVVAGGELAACDVAIEGHDATEDSAEVADTLLSGRMQCVVEAQAWEGGGSSLILDGMLPSGAPSWLNERTRWSTSEATVEGGAPLVPPRAPENEGGPTIAHLPGGCWVRVSKAWTTEASGLEPGLEIEVGSLCVEAAEVKTISHAYSAGGTLSRVRFSKVVAV